MHQLAKDYQNTDFEQHNTVADVFEVKKLTGLCLTTTNPNENPALGALDCSNEDPKERDFRMIGCKKTYDILYKVMKTKIIPILNSYTLPIIFL